VCLELVVDRAEVTALAERRGRRARDPGGTAHVQAVAVTIPSPAEDAPAGARATAHDAGPVCTARARAEFAQHTAASGATHRAEVGVSFPVIIPGIPSTGINMSGQRNAGVADLGPIGAFDGFSRSHRLLPPARNVDNDV